jgi:hypothetical protein
VNSEKDPPKDRDGDARDDASAAGAPKPPPWQVPKPELRPELLNPELFKPSGQRPGKSGKRGRGKPGSTSQPGPSGEPGQPDFPAPSPIIDPFARERERELNSAAARKKRSQRRTVVVGLGVTALLAGTITAIVASNEQDADYAQVCFNDETGERVEDTQCNSTAGRGGGLYAWYFYARGASVPGVGQNRSSYPNFTRTVPQGAKTSTGYSSKGGTVSRGGFGSSSKGGSTGG